MIRHLRERGEPIILFGETESEAYQRLKKLEMTMPEVLKVSDSFYTKGAIVSMKVKFFFFSFLFCQSADIMTSLCGVCLRVRVSDFSSESTRPRDMLFVLKDSLST